jgi:hypothetical protein
MKWGGENFSKGNGRLLRMHSWFDLSLCLKITFVIVKPVTTIL